ncbi:MAG: hypothetical protein JWP03_1875 [Phycisphaerales bacterium]|jgi:hypothetical protein|nr:hypothetical protein [Phycisphaerales bacterium]
MKTPPLTLSHLILGQLAVGERRLLTLVVGVRKGLGATDLKGDLSARVQASLRGLVASKAVVNTDGMYSLGAVGHILG